MIILLFNVALCFITDTGFYSKENLPDLETALLLLPFPLTFPEVLFQSFPVHTLPHYKNIQFKNCLTFY